MAMYCDSHCIIDTALIVSASTGDGHGEHDGIYVIHCHLALRGKWREAIYLYPNEEERNTAFKAISQLVINEEEMCELEDDEGHDDELGITYN